MKKILFCTVISLFYSCSVTQYHTAKPLKKGEKQFILAGDGYDLPIIQTAFRDIEKKYKKETYFYMLPMNPALEFNWGTDKNRDRSIKLSVFGQLSYATKYRLTGTDESKFYMSVRPELGVMLSPDNRINSHIWLKLPLLMTQKLGNFTTFTFSPGLTVVSGIETPQYPNIKFLFLNSNFALHFGRKNRFFISFGLIEYNDGYYKVYQQLSTGYIWKFSSKNKK